jgi:hypothetical protein
MVPDFIAIEIHIKPSTGLPSHEWHALMAAEYEYHGLDGTKEAPIIQLIAPQGRNLESVHDEIMDIISTARVEISFPYK